MIIGLIVLIAIPDNYDPEIRTKAVIVPLIFAGLAYSLYATGFWTSIPYVVNNKSIGFAYGVAIVIQNIGAFLGPLLVRDIIDDSKGNNYRMVNLIQIGLCALGLAFGILLWNYEVNQGKEVLLLNSVEAEKRYKYYK